jgi:hypothetical protein
MLYKEYNKDIGSIEFVLLNGMNNRDIQYIDISKHKSIGTDEFDKISKESKLLRLIYLLQNMRKNRHSIYSDETLLMCETTDVDKIFQTISFESLIADDIALLIQLFHAKETLVFSNTKLRMEQGIKIPEWLQLLIIMKMRYLSGEASLTVIIDSNAAKELLEYKKEDIPVFVYFYIIDGDSVSSNGHRFLKEVIQWK